MFISSFRRAFYNLVFFFFFLFDLVSKNYLSLYVCVCVSECVYVCMVKRYSSLLMSTFCTISMKYYQYPAFSFSVWLCVSAFSRKFEDRVVLLIAVDDTKLCFQTISIVNEFDEKRGKARMLPAAPTSKKTLSHFCPIKTDTTAKKHEELKCAQESRGETTLTTKKSVFLCLLFSLILSTHVFVILSPVVAVV